MAAFQMFRQNENKCISLRLLTKIRCGDALYYTTIAPDLTIYKHLKMGYCGFFHFKKLDS